MSFSLLAVGDVHFDAPSLLCAEDRKKLEALKKEAFKKAVDEAVAKNVSAFFICGDLYDEQAVSFETLIFLRKCFLQLASCSIKIMYAHGKSDPSAAPKIIETNNLIDFSHETERFELSQPDGSLQAVIYTSGFSNNAGMLLDGFEAKGTKYPTIGMMYLRDGFSSQGSFILDGLSNLNYDLFILGGYHHYIVAREEGNVIYPGSPTGTWFGDKAGGALYAQVNDSGQITLDKIPLSDVSWYEVEMQNITETDIGSLQRKIEVEIQSTSENMNNTFVRVVLSGRCFLSEEMTDEVIEEMRHNISETLGLSVLLEKENLLPMLPKSLFENTSPFVESVKIIDMLKGDSEKFTKLLEAVQKKNDLFYATVPEELKIKYQSDFQNGLLDAICKVMIKEAGYEN